MSVTVIIPTFGDLPLWLDLRDRAFQSVQAQTLKPDHVYMRHADTLSDARNIPASESDSEWLCFLDADDELDPGYLEAMMVAAGDLRQPATLGIVGSQVDASPVVIPRKHLLSGNYMVIGTLVRREQFLRLGGFRELPMYEDWDLWIRCWLDGAEDEAVPDAIYRVHVGEGSNRNQQSRAAQVQWFNKIRSEYVQVARAKGMA